MDAVVVRQIFSDCYDSTLLSSVMNEMKRHCEESRQTHAMPSITLMTQLCMSTLFDGDEVSLT